MYCTNKEDGCTTFGDPPPWHLVPHPPHDLTCLLALPRPPPHLRSFACHESDVILVV